MIIPIILIPLAYDMPLKFNEIRFTDKYSVSMTLFKPAPMIHSVREFQQCRLNRGGKSYRLDTPATLLKHIEELSDGAALELVRLDTSPYTFDLFAPRRGFVEIEVSEQLEHQSWRFGFRKHELIGSGYDGILSHGDWVKYKLTKASVRRQQDRFVLVDRWVVRELKGSSDRCQLVKVRDVINVVTKQIVRVDLKQSQYVQMKLVSFADRRTEDALILGKALPGVTE